jgi:Beta-lactamase
MCRMPLFPAVLFLTLMVPANAGRQKTDKDLADTAAKAVLKALNEDAAGDLHRLLVASFQKEQPLAEFKKFFRQQRDEFGKVSLGRDGTVEGGWWVYQVRGERKTFVLKLHLQANGRINGLKIAPDLIAELPAAPVSLADLKKRLGAAVERARESHRLPSISLALVKRDRIIWAEAFGYLNVAKKVKADPETVYVVGSIFKVVVATAVMKLADEGKVTLDGPVNRYLKKFKMVRDRKVENGLTLRHLLTHRGGLPEVGSQVRVWDGKLPIPLEDLLKTSGWLMEKPGEKERYSNLGFSLAAYVAGQVSAKPIPETFQDLVLKPLDMDRTAFATTAAMLENLAIPYRDAPNGKGVAATH